MSNIQVYLLGRSEITHGETTLRAADWSRRKAASLLQRLALQRRLLKDEAIDFLWPESDLTSGANNLYRAIHAIRQTLQTTFGPRIDEAVFSFEDGTLTLRDSVWVDATEFKKQAQAILTDLQPTLADLQSVVELYTGDLLPDDVYAEWAIAPRESFRRLQREVQLKLAMRAREAGDYARVVALLTPLLARDRADEIVPRYTEAEAAFSHAGNQAEAEHCAAALAGLQRPVTFSPSRSM